MVNLVWQAQKSGLRSPCLPSALNFLLDSMAVLTSDDSNDDFDGYIFSDGEPEENGNNDDNKSIIHKCN